MSRDTEGHPVLAGLLALAGVGLVVGLLVSGAALAASSMLGLGGDSGGASASSGESMYLPKPSDTGSPTDALVTLQPGEESPTTAAPTDSATPEFPISLSSAQTAVSPMEEIYLTGVYPGGDGKVVQVQRLEDDVWEDFASVDAVVQGETFSTYVLTARSGPNQFRVRDTDSETVSNEIQIQVG